MKKQLFSDRFKYFLPLQFLRVILVVGIFLMQLPMNGVYAQTSTITGKVSDALGSLVGVSVKVEGTANGVSSDASGNYNIIAPPDGKLVFTYIGYTTQIVSINDRRSIDVVMIAQSTSLGEVVVVGYGTQKKVSLTGAVSDIRGEELTRRPVSSIQQALQGQMPGLTILDQGGSPGNSNTTMRIRGITTLSSNNPLVIVDGIEQPLANINPDDIESISVLKDASSTAIYGSRAANGVILITSKRAKEGKGSVTYNAFYAEQNSVSKPEHMEIESYLRLQNLNYINAGAPAKYTEQQIQDYVNGNREQFPLPFDWYNVMLRTAPQVNHSLAVSGGSENFKGRLSLRYQDQDGTIANTNSKINEIRVNTDLKVSNKINVAGDVNYRYVNSVQPQNITEIFRLMMQNSIFTVPKYSDGSYGAGPQGNNPLLLAEGGGTDRSKNDYITGNIKGDWKII
ncbi:SusC/RagA family TonB-linked outer membrane protein, partial [Daejeonella sp.]|uniref:SusC/RagA family TonB-linked outer membrane protein n=1 Tax=Daejeonella sp. TaxID=2805397 RepID=UPI0030BB3E06